MPDEIEMTDEQKIEFGRQLVLKKLNEAMRDSATIPENLRADCYKIIREGLKPELILEDIIAQLVYSLMSYGIGASRVYDEIQLARKKLNGMNPSASSHLERAARYLHQFFSNSE